jgi:hypothetical protein
MARRRWKGPRLYRRPQSQTRHAREQCREPVGQRRVLDDEGQSDPAWCGVLLKRRPFRRWSGKPAGIRSPIGEFAGPANGLPRGDVWLLASCFLSRSTVRNANRQRRARQVPDRW